MQSGPGRPIETPWSPEREREREVCVWFNRQIINESRTMLLELGSPLKDTQTIRANMFISRLREQTAVWPYIHEKHWKDI